MDASPCVLCEWWIFVDYPSDSFFDVPGTKIIGLLFWLDVFLLFFQIHAVLCFECLVLKHFLKVPIFTNKLTLNYNKEVAQVWCL